MNQGIKHTQLTRVGYTYQDLVCIQTLIDWFHDPDLYEWVCIESNGGKDAFKGLDDVVALNTQGRYELKQVKFTTDPSRTDLTLSFDWLLDKKKNGTSLLQKFSSDIEKYAPQGRIECAELVTNRVPDELLKKCIIDGKIELAAISAHHVEVIKDQLGEAEVVKRLFKTLSLRHTQLSIDDLEKKLMDSLVPDHTDSEGWFRFLKYVERWATRKNQPSNLGRIRYRHLKEALADNNARVLSQLFEIPVGYVPPSEGFHMSMMDKTSSPGCWVISGMPGKGKSTYLSYLYNCLMAGGRRVLRHHYYLSSSSLGDRVSYENVSHSLISQIKEILPSTVPTNPNSLDLIDWIEIAATKTHKEGQPLVLIVDGLDHVSRERVDISQLEHLINRLLPFKDRLTLVLGTQPVGSSHLPSKLNALIPRKERWIDLPLMDLNAIKFWLSSLQDAGEVEVLPSGEHDEELAELSESFKYISDGYPLHLIFSLKSLVSEKKQLLSHEIRRLPLCPDGDIRSYYASLWASLTPRARDVLMLIASAEYIWPDKNSLGFCFEDSLSFSQSFDEVVHLLEHKRSGLYPFHGSILVFLRSLDEYKSSRLVCLEKARLWLQKGDHIHSTMGWGWVVEAYLKNPLPLLKNLTHEWMVSSFLGGFPPQHIEHIFSIAERFAFENQDYASLVRLRLNKIRIINGPEFQLQNYSEFVYLTLQGKAESYVLSWRADNLGQLEIEEVAVVSILYQKIDPEISERCLSELWRRLRFYAKLGGQYHNEKVERLISAILKTLSNFENPDMQRIFEFLERVGDSERFFGQLLNDLIDAGHEEKILEIETSMIPEESEPKFWETFTSICITSGIDILSRPEKEGISKCSLGLLALLIEGESVEIPNQKSISVPTSYDQAYEGFFHNLFISSLLKNLKKPQNPESINPLNDTEEALFIAQSCTAFISVAKDVADVFRSGKKISVPNIYNGLKLSSPKSINFKTSRISYAVSKALCMVAIDISALQKNNPKLDQDHIDQLKECAWWNSAIWLKLVAERKISILSDEVLEFYVGEAHHNLIKQEESTATLANNALDLAKQVFWIQGKPKLEEFLRQTALNTLGYGYRKDTTFSELYEAFEECSKHGVGDLPCWLRRTAPFVRNMFEFTEREIRHIPGEYLRLIGEHVPGQLVNEYRFNLGAENWSTANEALNVIVRQFPLTSDEEKNLIRSLTAHDSIYELEKRGLKNPTIEELYDEQISFLGGRPPTPRDPYSSSLDQKKTDIDNAIFRPNDLLDLLNKLGDEGVYNIGLYVGEWIAYWKSNGAAIDILSSFELLWNDGRATNRHLKQCLHQIFLLSEQVQGTKAAYRWAVLDSIENDHWLRWSGARAQEKLTCYATAYKYKWEDFLADTLGVVSSDIRKQDRVIVPSTILVSFLLSADQVDLAVHIVEEMCLSLEAEISHLPISIVEWEGRDLSYEQIASELLLEHFKWPDRFGRLRTATQISGLLSRSPQFRELYIASLAQQKNEVQITDLLAVLQFIGPDFFSLERLEQSIRYPSILSDQILKVIGYDLSEKPSNLKYSTHLGENDYQPSGAYEKSKNGMAPIFFNAIEDLGTKYDYPLDEHMSAEWHEICKRKEFIYPSAHNFCNDQFYMQDRILCSLSFQAESAVLSAYLRTLAFAVERLTVPFDEVFTLIPDAAAFCGYLSRLSPSEKPVGWPQLNSVGKDYDLPDQNHALEVYLKTIADSDGLTLRASGPVLRDVSGVNIDLDIAAVRVGIDGCTDAEVIYRDLVEGRRNRFLHNVATLSEQHYPPAGRWEVDLLLRGFDKPAFAIGSYGHPEREVTENSVLYSLGGTVNAEWKYWTDSWYPARYYPLGPSIGTYLCMPPDITQELLAKIDERVFLVAKLTVLDKRGFGADDVPKTYYAMRMCAKRLIYGVS